MYFESTLSNNNSGQLLLNYGHSRFQDHKKKIRNNHSYIQKGVYILHCKLSTSRSLFTKIIKPTKVLYHITSTPSNNKYEISFTLILVILPSWQVAVTLGVKDDSV
jgi:hypothetical protein